MGTPLIPNNLYRATCRMGRTFFSESLKPRSFSCPRLPVLDSMVEQFKIINPKPLEKTAVVYVHHALQTSVSLLDSLFQLSLSPKNTFVLGKRYSDNLDVIQKVKDYGVYYQPSSKQVGLGGFEESFIRDTVLLWSEVSRQLQNNTEIKNVLILDHGGYAANFIPSDIREKFHVIGLEKTSGGLGRFSAPSFPLINVAHCAAKKLFEPKLIGAAVLAKLKPVIDMTAMQPTECGVIGYGCIGQAIAQNLLDLGHRVMVYDINPVQLKGIPARKNLLPTNDLSTLVNFSKFVFGCSGQDVTQSTDAFRLAPENKTLISCSSEDREFLTLLEHMQRIYNGKARAMAQVFKDVTYTNDFDHQIKILRAGFPYNFDDTGESVPANDIQLTRALVLAGVFQAIDCLKKPDFTQNAGLYSLDAELQQYVVQEWLKYQKSPPMERKFANKDWVAENSPGIKEILSFHLEENLAQTSYQSTAFNKNS